MTSSAVYSMAMKAVLTLLALDNLVKNNTCQTNEDFLR